MKTIFRTTAAIAITALLGFASTAWAVNPTLTLNATGTSNTVQVTVTGDPNSSVLLNFYGNSFYQSQYIGSTNASGFFSNVLNAATYGIVPGMQVSVTVNNQQSAIMAWPYVNNNPYLYTGFGVSLSQNSVTVAPGQSTTVTITGGAQPYLMYPNGSPTVFQSIIGNNTLQIIGQNPGSGSLLICPSTGQSSGCATLYISVTSAYYPTPTPYYPTPTPYYPYPTATPYYPYGNVNPMAFNQSTVNIAVGQNAAITLSGGQGFGYYIAYNSNQNGLQATVNGNTLTVTGTTPGADVVVVCSSNTTCGAVTVIVAQTGGTTTGTWTLCASENQFCSFPGTRQVRYGANGSFVYRTLTNGVTCSNAIFGDPIFGVVKQCWYSY